MKRSFNILLLAILTLSFGVLRSQNLVPNHDFSEINDCNPDPALVDQKDYLLHWFSPPSQVDSLLQDWMNFFHDCKKDALTGPNSRGWIEAHPGRIDTFRRFNCGEGFIFLERPETREGQGYILLNCLDSVKQNFWAYGHEFPGCQLDSAYYSGVLSNSRLRNFASVHLTNPLDSGVEYTVEYHIMLERHGPTYSFQTYPINGLGVYLSKDTLYSSDYLTQNLQPIAQTNRHVVESQNWVKVTGTFKAQGDEQFLTLGNFKKSSQTDFIMLPLDTPGYKEFSSSYYYDAIYLYKSTDTLFNLRLPPDTTLCPGESLNLRPELDDGFKLEDTTKTWLWSTGSTDSVITVSEPGTYWAKVTYNDRWWDSDTIVIHPYDAYQSGLPPDTLVCEERDFTLRVPIRPDIGLKWNTGNRQYFQRVSPPGGWYWIAYEDECGTHYDSTYVEFQSCDTNQAPVLYIPNSFSPNGDGLNDSWSIANLPKDNEVWVFNRWGELVFNQKNYEGNWEGMGLEGERLREGVYVFRIRYHYYPGITNDEQGWLQLVR